MAGIQSYIFGEGTPDTYESLQSKRKTAERFGQMAMRTPQNLGEGLSSLGQAIAYRRLMSQADKGDAKGRDEFNSVFQGLLGGMGGGSPSVSSMGGGGSPGGTWTPGQAPKVTDTPGMEGGNSFNMPAAPDPSGGAQLGFGSAAMTPQEMIIAGAEQRGLNPIDVATAISYETGGKFDPMIAGPTTQWGQHRGLIQFGEPQAQQYGADFSSPDAAMRSQLNPNDGAVWNYLDQTGVKPGMGLDNIYSAINAGAPGRFGASDANNGGAPGTVADKVAGMGDHRAKAAQFLGGTWTPAAGGSVTMSAQNAPGGAPMAPQGGMGGINPAMIEALSNPYATEGQKMVLGALLQQQIAGMAPKSEMEMIALEQARLDLEQDRDPSAQVPEAVRTRQIFAEQAGLQPGMPGYSTYMATGELPQAPEAPTTKQVKLADGSEVMVQWNGETQNWDASPIPEGGTGGMGSGKLTEGQSKLTLFQTLQTSTEPVLLDAETQFDPANMADKAAANVPIVGNYFTSPEYQVYTTAAAAWAEGALRISTGAAATEPEIQRTLKTYFAQPGDTPQTVSFKAKMREMYGSAVNNALGKKSENAPLPLPSEFAQKNPLPGTPEAGKPAAGPEVGTVEDGYRFLGGDPAYEQNWEKVQ